MYKTILVPLDGSSRAELILPQVEALHFAFRSEIVLVRIVNPLPSMVGRSDLLLIDSAKEESRQLGVARAYLEKVRKELAARSIVATTVLLQGDAKRCILRLAVQMSADLIAMVSYEQTGVKRIMVGGTANWVIQHSNSPVLIYRVVSESHL